TNPRKEFDDEALNELAETIRAHGILEPLVVRPQKNNRSEFEIIAGERRWRAAQLAGLSTVPCVVRDDLQDPEVLEIQFIENLQRADLKPIEEARGFKRLLDTPSPSGMFLYTAEGLAAKLGKSRSYVFERLKLLEASAPVREALEEGKLAPRTALEIERAGLPPEQKQAVVSKIVNENLSTREATKLIDSHEKQRGMVNEALAEIKHARKVKDLFESLPDGTPEQDEAEASRVAAANAANWCESAFGEAGPGMLGKGPVEQKPKPIDPLDYAAVLASTPEPGSAAYYHKQRIRQEFEEDFRHKLLIDITMFFSSGRGRSANVNELEKVAKALDSFISVGAIRDNVLRTMEAAARARVAALEKDFPKKKPKPKAKAEPVRMEKRSNGPGYQKALSTEAKARLQRMRWAKSKKSSSVRA
ncbi:MAG: ParB/RepB/Spo0J family partition protein, partial [Verrucomicrobiota bacterium]